MRSLSAPGNTISEYGLIGLLILGGCVIALTGLGKNLWGNLDHLQTALIKKPAPSPTLINSTLAGAGLNDSAMQLGMGDISSTVNSANFKAVEETIRVAGANGATNELASALAAYARQLAVNGELTPEQANLLGRLANEGHKLASAEKALEDAFAQGKSTITYEGKNYSLKDYSDLFGFNRLYGVVGSTHSMDDQLRYAQPMTAPFMTLYDQAKQRGALDDPTVSTVISNLSTQITVASDLVKWNVEEAVQSGRTQADYQNRLRMGYGTAMVQINLQDLSNLPASDFTHNRSTAICSTDGNSQDSGTSCSPR